MNQSEKNCRKLLPTEITKTPIYMYIQRGALFEHYFLTVIESSFYILNCQFIKLLHIFGFFMLIEICQ